MEFVGSSRGLFQTDNNEAKTLADAHCDLADVNGINLTKPRWTFVTGFRSERNHRRQVFVVGRVEGSTSVK